MSGAIDPMMIGLRLSPQSGLPVIIVVPATRVRRRQRCNQRQAVDTGENTSCAMSRMSGAGKPVLCATHENEFATVASTGNV
jgi:hypothetical protein